MIVLLLPFVALSRAQPIPTDQAAFRRGEAVFKSLCYNCHGADGRGAERYDAPGFLMGPPLVNSPRVAGHRDYVINVLLYGLTGPVEGTKYLEIMLPFGMNHDAWIADVATFLRGSFGPGLSPVAPGDVARIRAAGGKREAWTVADLELRIPRLVSLEHAKLSSNDPRGMAREAIERAGWRSAGPAGKNLWLQIELPTPENIGDVEFVSSPASEFALLVSDDGKDWTEAGQGRRLQGWVNVKVKRPVPVRFARIVVAAAPSSAPNWSMSNLRVYAAP